MADTTLAPDSAAMAEARHPELIIGLVTPLGTGTETLASKLVGQLARWSYTSEVIHVSDLLGSEAPRDEHEDARIERLIEAGNDWAKDHSSPNGLVPLMVKAVQSRRAARNAILGVEQGPSDDPTTRAIPRHAYILHSLKRPVEVEALRNIYGSLFILLGCYPKDVTRLKSLNKRLETRLFFGEDARSSRSRELMDRDEREGSEYGQDVRKTYPLADFFIPKSLNPKSSVRAIFGDGTLAPTDGEYAMFSAYSASARSLSSSRKVGAAIVQDGRVVSTGWNDVPFIAGEEPDAARGIDTSEHAKQELIISTLRDLNKANWLEARWANLVSEALGESPGIDEKTRTVQLAELNRAARETLGKSPISDVIEYQRAVHAEMWAILDAANRGVALQGSSIYGTTYPCHLCWKHIFAVGIQRMYFIDSYPKSQATRMYSTTSVMLERYVGVAPNRYLRYFADRRPTASDSEGRIVQPNRAVAQPLVHQDDIASYIDRELMFLSLNLPTDGDSHV